VVAGNEARGQNRTTKTKWSEVAPYIRFRYERARERLPKAGTVYELGCGIGVGLNYLAESRPDLNFVGFDSSPEAVSFGAGAFKTTGNIRLLHSRSLADVEDKMLAHGFLVALEVIEHLDDREFEFFKRNVLQRIDEAIFSFPYSQKNIEGTNHLQSIDIYTIFEIFPGFETIFLRRGSIKFIGYWRRADRAYTLEPLGVRGERKAVAGIANWC